MAYYCYKCGHEIEFAVHGGIVVGRLDTCEHCGTYLHVCRNCVFYDPGRSNNCRELITEFVSNPEEPNFCSSFRFRELDAPPAHEDPEKAKAKLEDLFKNLKD